MGDTIKILYIEDDQDIRTITQIALDNENFELLMYESGKLALLEAQSLKPDLFLFDVMMPDLDGPSTLKKLRHYPHLINIPVIFMTAKIQPSELNEYLEMGAIGVISKPFDPMSLADEIIALYNSQ
ncbi:Response regulator receiver domain-containing protein [Pseudoalteromonas denitrificans DSM 6059]|uniref:Response regulator receiver domain-containing protein n=2 Tax=Pseudoalteromonas TaxID=53246 RepID=A0A1I1PX14_9GAMM|nr:Response regulator receiver domain-containing protein [Pseudoalteromonas denitrificans DSM 6059]